MIRLRFIISPMIQTAVEVVNRTDANKFWVKLA